MNQIVINKIKRTGNRFDYSFSIGGEWKRYFTEEPFYIEYNSDISHVPDSVAIIPLLCNILPIAWLNDAHIFLDEIDQDFYNSIDQIKQGYKNMYPRVDFKGSIHAKQIIDNISDNIGSAAMLFSGGVDSYHTFISHIEEKPALAILWGSDLTFEDEKGWNLVKAHVESTAQKYQLEFVTVKTSFRRFIDEYALSIFVWENAGDGWWHGFQHGIGILGHMAPYAYVQHLNKVYISSSFAAEDKGRYTCASDPTIDNCLKFCGCQVVHDGYEANRQQKIHDICQYARTTNQKIQLRVCWESKGGSNCCHCEKCLRTILAILAEKEAPQQYGLEYRNEEFKKMMWNFRVNGYYNSHFRYKYINATFRKNYSFCEMDRSLRWFYKLDYNQKQLRLDELFFKVIRKAKSIYQRSKKNKWLTFFRNRN